MKVETLDRTISVAGQNATYNEYIDVSTTGPLAKTYKLHIYIFSDSYAKQCRANISLWNGAEWKQVYYISNGIMQTKNALASICVTPLDADFEADRDKLFDMAMKIVGIQDTPKKAVPRK